jgi:hypothetical protein
MTVQTISYRRYLDISRKHSAVTNPVTNRPRRQAAITISNSFPLTDDHFELPQTRDEILLAIAHGLFARLTPLRLAAQTIRTASADRPEIVVAIDMIDLQIAVIARLAENLMAATSFQAKGLGNRIDPG